jgi:hypothetical protein
LIRLQEAIGRIYNMLGRSESKRYQGNEIETETTSTETETRLDDYLGGMDEIEEATEEAEEAEEAETKRPRKKSEKRTEDELEYFFRRIDEIRQFCISREATDPIDEIGIRPGEAAGRLIPRGIPADAILAAMSTHWTEANREDAKIRPFDFLSLSKQIMSERDLRSEWVAKGNTDPLHDMFGYTLVLTEARQPVYLYGPKGTGKSHLAKQIAKWHGLDYGETPMSEGASRGDLLGRLTASSERPFISAEFCNIYAAGGVFNFEEIDASDSRMLIVLNNALAGEGFYNSNNGERMTKSGDFIALATANTLSQGATKFYARNKLDAATLDRWNCGRVFIRFDRNLEYFKVFGRMPEKDMNVR